MLSVAYSPDGQLLASASADKTVFLWYTRKPQINNRPLAGHLDRVNSVAFSPDGNLLASASSDTTIIVWNVATRSIVNKLSGHTAQVNSAVFSPDGKILASASNDKTVLLWEVPKEGETGLPQPIDQLAGHTDAVNSVAFSPDGKLLASASTDRTIILWDVATRQLAGLFVGHTGKVSSVAFSPNGGLLASGSDDQTVILWDVATRQPVGQPLNRHFDAVSSVAFSPNGRWLASCIDNKTVILWDVATHQLVAEPPNPHFDAVFSVAFSPNSQTVALGQAGGGISLWNIQAQIAAVETVQATAALVKPAETVQVTAAPVGPTQTVQLNADGTPRKTYSDLVVGFAQVGGESDWRYANTLSMKETAKQLGVTLKFSDMQAKQENQLQAIRMFIADQVDVIAVAPVVPVGYEAVFEEAKAAGIPVILVDRQVDGLEDYYVSRLASDFTEEGRKAARVLARLMNGQANIVELSGTAGSQVTIERGGGFREVLQDYPGMKIIDTQTGDFTRYTAKGSMETLLRKYGNRINAVYAHNDEMALGTIEAIEEYGLKPGVDIKLVSIDAVRGAFQAMIEGKLNATIECNPMMGPQFYELALKVANGETVPRWVKTNEDIFYPDNAAEILPTRNY